MEWCEFSFQYHIKDASLLKKAGLILAFIITLFFIESVPSIQRLSLGWCAFTGVILLLLISEYDLDVSMEFITLFFVLKPVVI